MSLMKHSFKAKLKKRLFGIYTYGSELVNPQLTPEELAKYYGGRTYIYNTTNKGLSQMSLSSIGQTTHAVRTDICEREIEKILKNLDTGWAASVLIISPFKASVLTALLLTKTASPSRVRYTVKGIRGSKDFTFGEDDFSTAHRVPIIGLFENTKNDVIITIEDEKTHTVNNYPIKIKMPDVMKEYYDIQLKMSYSAHDITPEEEHFYEVSGGYRGPTCIFDSHANVRVFFSRKPQYYGIYPLEKGLFLYPEHLLKRPTFGAPLSVVTHEMDWFGRYHHTYYHPIGYHHNAALLPDGNFLTPSSSFYNRHVENKVIKIDRETGEELDSICMDDLFDEKFQEMLDWAHVNCISPCDNPDEMILSLRNIHAIIKVNMPEKKLLWIVANKEFFKGTAEEDLVLDCEGDFDPWFFQQHSAVIMKNFPNADPDRLYITFYDNHEAHRRPVDWFDKKGTAYGMIISVDEKNRSFRLEKRFPTSYAITRANTEYDEKTNHFFTMDARLEDQSNGIAADMRIWDFDTGEMVREYTINQDFFAIHQIDFDYDSMAKPLDPKRRLFRGELYNAKKCKLPEGINPDLPTPGADPDYVSERVRYNRYGDNFLVWSVDQNVNRIVLVGDNGECYDVNFRRVTKDLTLSQPIKKLRDNCYWRFMPLKDIPEGTYTVYVRYKKKYYSTTKVITIKD